MNSHPQGHAHRHDHNHQHTHAHPHGHAHGPVAHTAQASGPLRVLAAWGRWVEGASFLALASWQRVLWVSPVVLLLWLGVWWAQA